MTLESYTTEVSACIWIVRLGECLSPLSQEIFKIVDAQSVRPLSPEFWLVTFESSKRFDLESVCMFFRWIMPVEYIWPINPFKADKFIEKSAQGLCKRFSSATHLSEIVVTVPLQKPKFTTLGSNLKGRLQQIMPLKSELNSANLNLFLSEKGVCAGRARSAVVKSRRPGGTRFVNQSSSVSRAAGKIVEGLEHLHMYGIALKPGDSVLELGASPGGVTQELLNREFRVVAVDRAPLSVSLKTHPLLTFKQCSSESISVEKGAFQLIVSDMNGPFQASFAEVLRLSASLTAGGGVFFTMKFGVEVSAKRLIESIGELRSQAKNVGLEQKMVTHSTFNRMELTCLFARNDASHL